MSTSKHIADNFIPSANHILLEPVESSNKFKIPKKSEGLTSESRIGKVLKVGEEELNDFGVLKIVDCKVGDTVVYVHEINQPVLEIDFKEYPIVRFGAVLGVIEDE